MTKRELIELLSDMNDNDEIYVWNGLVEDYQDISPEVVTLKVARKTKENHKLECITEYCIENSIRPSAISEKAMKSIDEEVHNYEIEDYELANSFMNDEILNKYYSDQKDIKVLDLTPRDKVYFDRLGSISY